MSLPDQTRLGGSWLTASLVLNEWPGPSTLVYGDGGGLSGWMLDLDLITPSSVNLGDGDNQAYWGSILASVEAKANASMSVLPLSSRTDVETPTQRYQHHRLVGTGTFLPFLEPNHQQ